ncbi:galactose mutarotase isoform X3 [Scyliorhinus torazame]|uniref:galactose mutarotase isoform X3 n=1 Tax=Scyliorhinus torazame TaxID=75743 RepID=UPI003B5C2759
MTEVSSDVFGKLPDGRPVERFTLRSRGVTLRVLSLGGIVSSLETGDRHGNMADIVLGFDNLQGYINKHPYFGAVVGRVANRIAEGKFSIDGKEYQLPINNGPNSIHGGLKGFDKGFPNIYDHEVSIEAKSYLPVDMTSIPTGEIASVENTRFDLKKPVVLGNRIPNELAGGFDHNFCLNCSKQRSPCARVYHQPSGRLLQIETTQPGVQFYTANFLDGSLKGKGGAMYPKHSAFCLETQNWPDAVNKMNFPDALLRPGEEYDHTTWFKFSVL